MHGYILFQKPGMPLEEHTADNPTRGGLIRALEGAVPADAHVVGLALGPDDKRALRLIA